MPGTTALQALFTKKSVCDKACGASQIGQSQRYAVESGFIGPSRAWLSGCAVCASESGWRRAGRPAAHDRDHAHHAHDCNLVRGHGLLAAWRRQPAHVYLRGCLRCRNYLQAQTLHDGFNCQVHGVQHLGQHRIRLDFQMVGLQFNRHMALAQLVGGTRQVEGRTMRRVGRVA